MRFRYKSFIAFFFTEVQLFNEKNLLSLLSSPEVILTSSRFDLIVLTRTMINNQFLFSKLCQCKLLKNDYIL